MIKTIIRSIKDMVMVFDCQGEQIPCCQGQYSVVREKILRCAPQDAVFAHGISSTGQLQQVPRYAW